MAVGKLPDVDLEGSEESLFAEINITPLTDLFLVMMIIFIVSANVSVDQAKRQSSEADRVSEEIRQQVAATNRSGMKVNLPSGTAQEIDPSTKSITVTILKSGEIRVKFGSDDRTIRPEDLRRVFQTAFVKNKDTQVVLKADTGVPHGTVVSVMERAKSVGLTKLAIATQGGG